MAEVNFQEAEACAKTQAKATSTCAGRKRERDPSEISVASTRRGLPRLPWFRKREPDEPEDDENVEDEGPFDRFLPDYVDKQVENTEVLPTVSGGGSSIDFNLLGWNGNATDRDPQYGPAPAERHLREPGDLGRDLPQALRVYFVVVGGLPFKLPRLPGYPRKFLDGERLTEQDLILNGAAVIREQLREATLDFDVVYLVDALLAKTFLPAARRGGVDEVALGFEASARHVLFEIARVFPMWRLVSVRQKRTKFYQGSSWTRLRSEAPSAWTISTTSLRAGAPIMIVLRNFLDGSFGNKQADDDENAEKKTDDWEKLWRDMVGNLIKHDAAKLLEVNALTENLAEHLHPRLLDPLDGVVLKEAGRAHRHVSRGPLVTDPKEQRQAEDSLAWAGARDPADLADRWPKLWEVMGKVAVTILEHRDKTHELQDLHRCFGDAPARSPPGDDVVREVRAEVARALGVDPSRGEHHAEASPWRHHLVRRVQLLSGDGDLPLGGWLEHGAPMDIHMPIDLSSGAFPEHVSEATRSPPRSARRSASAEPSVFPRLPGREAATWT